MIIWTSLSRRKTLLCMPYLSSDHMLWLHNSECNTALQPKSNAQSSNKAGCKQQTHNSGMPLASKWGSAFLINVTLVSIEYHWYTHIEEPPNCSPWFGAHLIAHIFCGNPCSHHKQSSVMPPLCPPDCILIPPTATLASNTSLSHLYSHTTLALLDPIKKSTIPAGLLTLVLQVLKTSAN